MEVAGRLDHQVKIDGHRIELGEIEHALRSLPTIHDAVVVAVPDASGTYELHAFIVATLSVDGQHIRQALVELLPPPMIPRVVHSVRELPVSVAGKVDRQRLVELIATDHESAPATAEPASGTLDRMGALWCELLELDSVDRSMDFFELGGRSLTAVRLAFLIEETFGVSVPVASIFEAPTVTALSALVDRERGVAPAEAPAERSTGEPDAPAQTTQPETAGAGAAQPGSAGTGSADRMAALWCELLELDSVDRSMDFFELGGRSLTAVRLAFLIEETFGVSVPVASIFEAPTVTALSALIDAELGNEAATREEPVVDATAEVAVEQAPPAVEVLSPATIWTEDAADVDATTSQIDDLTTSPTESASDNRAEVAQPTLASMSQPIRLHMDQAPLSVGQQRMWLHERLLPETMPYLIPVSYRLRGPLDVSAFEAALNELVARHDALRTRIVLGPENRPVQIVDPVGAGRSVANPIMTQVDLAAADPHERSEQAATLAAEFKTQHFDVEVEHPFRALLVAVSPTDHALTLVFHHLAMDDHGVGLVLRELGALYAAALDENLAGALAPPPLQFSDFAIWQRARLSAGANDASHDFWSETLGQEPQAIEVPGRRVDPRPGGQIIDHEVEIPSSVSAELLGLAERSGTSPFQLVVALVTLMFNRLTGQDNVIVGAPGSERRGGSLDEVVGLFVNTMVLRTEVSPSSTFKDLLSAVRMTVAQALDHGGAPLDSVLDQLNVERDGTRLPLVSVICSYREQVSDAPLHLAGLDVDRLRLPSITAGAVADLMVSAHRERDGRLAISIRHDDGVVANESVAQLAETLQQLAVAVTRAADEPISRLALIDEGEEQWLAHALNDNDCAFPAETRLDGTFAEVAARHGSSTAVADASRRLSYAQLDADSTALAARLAEAGVAHGDTVAIELDRSVELVVATLAVLKAGAVYVPLDSAAPASRREQILDLAGARFVVTAGVDHELVINIDDRPPVTLPTHGDDVAAYVMFTSGSTGVPKGVAVSHRSVQRTVHDVDFAHLDSSVVMAMASNPAFDAMTLEIWGALMNGGRIEVIDRDTLGDPGRSIGHCVRGR